MKKLILISTLLLLAMLTATGALAANVTLAWDPSPSTAVVGYKIYYKTGSAPTYNGTGIVQGSSPIDAGSNLNIPLSGLLDGVIYTFTVTAYDNTGTESLFAEEITWTSNGPAPYIPALTYPANRAQNLPTTVVFSWSPPSDGRTVSYSLFFGTDPTLSDAQIASVVPMGKAPGHPVSPLPLVASAGILSLGLFVRRAKWLQITTVFAGMVLLLWGCGGDAGSGLSIAEPGNDNQTPQVQSFTSVIPDISENSFEIYDFEPGTTYYWKVQADDGSTVTESPVQSFVTAAN